LGQHIFVAFFDNPFQYIVVAARKLFVVDVCVDEPVESAVHHAKRRQIPAIFQMFDDLKEEFVGKFEEPHEGSSDAPLKRRSLDADGKERRW
jgi:hypothetical protein